MRHPQAHEHSGAFRTVATVFAFELVVARLTAQGVTGHDVAVSAAAWAAVGVAIGFLVPRLEGRGALGAILAIGVARSPVAVMATSLLLPGVEGHPLHTILCALFVVAIPVLPAIMGVRGFPNPAEVIAPLTAATIFALVSAAGGWPDVSVYAPVAILWLAVALFARRLSVAILCAVTAAAAASLVIEPPPLEWDASAPRAQADAPDIYLLTLDTLRRDTAVTMDSFGLLASHGVRFDAAQSPSPWTLPSMATLMTGEPPDIHGATAPDLKASHPIDARVPTLATVLRELGYDTAAVVAANPFLGQSFGFRRGFATFDHALSASRNPLPRGRTISNLVRPIMARVLRREVGLPHWNGNVVVDRARHVLAHRRGRPLLLWMHFMDCHTPYDRLAELPPKVRERLKLGNREAVQEFYRDREDRRAALRAAYDNQAKHLDRAITRFLDIIDRRRARPAIVVMVGDHGEELFERDSIGHGHQLHEELIGVPLVIRGLPGAISGQRIATPISPGAIFPALVAAAGGNIAGQASDPLSPDPLEVQISSFLAYSGTTGHSVAVRRGNWKAMFGDSDRVALFDLAGDPGEDHDVSGIHPEIVSSLRRHARHPPPPRSEATVLTESEREALRQLGYDVGE